jgi:hypothetical protein
MTRTLKLESSPAIYIAVGTNPTSDYLSFYWEGIARVAAPTVKKGLLKLAEEVHPSRNEITKNLYENGRIEVLWKLEAPPVGTIAHAVLHGDPIEAVTVGEFRFLLSSTPGVAESFVTTEFVDTHVRDVLQLARETDQVPAARLVEDLRGWYLEKGQFHQDTNN